MDLDILMTEGSILLDVLDCGDGQLALHFSAGHLEVEHTVEQLTHTFKTGSVFAV